MSDFEKASLGQVLSFRGDTEMLQEAADTIEAIRSGGVDAFVMNNGAGEQVFVLREADYPYLSFIERMNEGAVTLSTRGLILYANPRFAEMLKVPLDQILESPFTDFLMEKGSLDSMLAAESSGHAELELQAGDGATVPAYISYSPLRRGERAWTALLVMDLTERKRQQAALQEAEKFALLGKAAAILCHEIAGPLSAMYTTVQMMQRRLRKAGSENSLSNIEELNTEISRLTELLNDFRFLSVTNLNLCPTDLAALIADSLQVVAAQAQEAGIGIEQKVPSGLPPVKLDRDRMKQVLFNLYRNAMEAMPHGGTLTVSARCPRDRAVIEIGDTGTGVATAGIDIFDLFTTTKPRGTGLGLAIVKQIVVSHEGTITYTSEAGNGTKFEITLPLRPAA